MERDDRILLVMLCRCPSRRGVLSTYGYLAQEGRGTEGDRSPRGSVRGCVARDARGDDVSTDKFVDAAREGDASAESGGKGQSASSRGRDALRVPEHRYTSDGLRVAM